MMPLWFVGIAIICPIEIDYEAGPGAGPNEEERGQPHVQSDATWAHLVIGQLSVRPEEDVAGVSNWHESNASSRPPPSILPPPPCQIWHAILLALLLPPQDPAST
jgi:hypothetical protein